MERLNTNQNRETFIAENIAEKKGRLSSHNPFTCFVNIDSPEPDLGFLTASVLTAC
ncbi:hypothetical protein ACFL2C_02170 [Patescibacteria group bacterium]